ncbi:hypothetical protein OIE49_36435 [Streptomyces sp. NBC_01788]|uniref:hypothetical protein n=1 Tax=Streptomyces sp. NBC_01788 TaxID=2975940 RepID=UPI002DDC843C|nr:hypothetical protein [Streptomyces sp. NBC_01788]WSB30884.1 hypothetical protein OIE49_36435 [Streptomyces sp. NBC_01788]
MGVDTASCVTCSTASEEVNHVCGDVIRVVQQDGDVLAIGVVKASGDSGDDAELGVEGVGNPAGR